MGRVCQSPPASAPLLLLGLVIGWGALRPVELGAATFPLHWRWSNPQPHGNNVVDMAYAASLGLTVQVAERGQVYSSSDGVNWFAHASGTTNWLRAVTFLGDRILVTGQEGRVLYADATDDFRTGSLLDGDTSDWLEGVAASASLGVAVGDNGAVYTSPDGLSWKRQSSGVSAWLRGIAYGNSRFVAVGESGTILTSPNGTNWTRRASGTTENLNRVTYTGAGFLAVGEGGVVRVSSATGTSWDSENIGGTTNNLFCPAAADTDLLVAGDQEVRLFDGGRWTNQLSRLDGPPPWTYYSAVGQPGYFLIAGRTGLMAEAYRTNSSAYTWYSASDAVRNWLFDAAWISGSHANFYVAVGDFATIMTSGNGLDWSLELTPLPATNSVLLGVGGDANLLLAVGSQGTLLISPNVLTNVLYTNASGIILTQTVSTLGILWQAIEPRPVTHDLQGVSFFNGLYLVSGDGGVVLTSPDGTNWTRRATPTTNLLSGLTSLPGRVVATGDNGTILVSADATNWTAVSSGTTNWLYRVRGLNGALVAVGENGAVVTSPDGLRWTGQASGTTKWLKDAAWVAGTYFAVGTQGTLLSSPDAVAWTNRGLITAKSLEAVATDAYQLVAVGIEGVILRSQVVPDPTPIQILDYSRVTSLSDGSFLNLFLFGGKPDQRFTLDYRTDFTSHATNVWRTGPTLEFQDGSGTLLYLETVPASNAPPREFYRATLPL